MIPKYLFINSSCNNAARSSGNKASNPELDESWKSGRPGD